MKKLRLIVAALIIYAVAWSQLSTAPVLQNGGPLGTPSSCVITACTGAPTFTSINGLTITGTTGTFTLTNGKTFSVSNTLTQAGTDSTTQTFPSLSANMVGLLSAQLGGTDASTGLVAATINVTETAFATTYQIPANYLILNKTLRVTWTFQMLSSSSAVTTDIRVRIGGTGVDGTIAYDSGAAATTNSISNRGMTFEMLITGTAAAGSSVNVEFGTRACNGVTITGCNPANTIAQPVAVATNGALNIYTTVQFGGNTAGNSVKLRQMLVEALN